MEGDTQSQLISCILGQLTNMKKKYNSNLFLNTCIKLPIVKIRANKKPHRHLI